MNELFLIRGLIMKKIFLILCLVFSNTAFSESVSRSDQLAICGQSGELAANLWRLAKVAGKQCEDVPQVNEIKQIVTDEALKVIVEACGKASRESAYFYASSWCMDMIGDINNIKRK